MNLTIEHSKRCRSEGYDVHSLLAWFICISEETLDAIQAFVQFCQIPVGKAHGHLLDTQAAFRADPSVVSSLKRPLEGSLGKSQK